MEKLKCPKCHHEIKDDEKYCNTCGLCLKNITKERVIELLKLDLAGYKMRLDSVVNTGDIKLFSEKVKTLETAIEALESTIQEKSEDIMTKFLKQQKEVKTKINRGEIKEGSIEYVNTLLGTDLSEEQFSALAIFDFTIKEYRLVEILKVLKILGVI